MKYKLFIFNHCLYSWLDVMLNVLPMTTVQATKHVINYVVSIHVKELVEQELIAKWKTTNLFALAQRDTLDIHLNLVDHSQKVYIFLFLYNIYLFDFIYLRELF